MKALLPLILFLPALGAVFVMLIPRSETAVHRGVGLVFSGLTFVVSLALLQYFNVETGDFQIGPEMKWIPGLGAEFKLGIDGISLWLVLLTTFLTPIVLLSAHGSVGVKVREFVACMLILETGMLGAFVALDIFLFYIFWELMLIPMYLLIGIWGGQRRLKAAIKFVLYTMVGSLLMLVAIFYLYVQAGAALGYGTTDLEELRTVVLPRTAQVWCFAVFALAFAIKVPLFPVHTWLPDAHTEAPTAGSVILAGVLLKFGVYGLLRFAMPLFPYGAAVAAPYIAILSVAGIVYGAVVAFAQTDVKKLVAYSSVSHLGFCTLGAIALTAQGIEGSIFAMLSHGLTTSGLFLCIGVLYERRHTRRMDEYGGVWTRMPVFGGIFLIMVLGSAGLPGLSGFVGEFLTILGTFVAHLGFPESWPSFLPTTKVLAAVAATGVILGAVYLLYMFQKVMFGPITREANQTLKDVNGRELIVFMPLIVMVFVMGLLPGAFLKPMEKTVAQFQDCYWHKLGQPDKDKAYTVDMKKCPSRPTIGTIRPAPKSPTARPTPVRRPPPADARNPRRLQPSRPGQPGAPRPGGSR